MAKRKAEHEHHGGAWKVAYSDFITSMMALFMVLWILSQNVEVKESVQEYFLDPFSATVMRSPGIVSDDSNYPSQPPQVKQPNKVLIDQQELWKIAQQFFKLLKIDNDDSESPIDVEVHDDGMFITIYNRDDQPIFIEGTTEFTEWGKFVMQGTAWLLDRVSDMPVKIASHTPAGIKYPEGYDAWELTTDMSNAVRKELTYWGMTNNRVHRLTGYGDKLPIGTLEPEDRRNQRIELELTIPDTDKPKPGPTIVP